MIGEEIHRKTTLMFILELSLPNDLPYVPQLGADGFFPVRLLNLFKIRKLCLLWSYWELASQEIASQELTDKCEYPLKSIGNVR